MRAKNKSGEKPGYFRRAYNYFLSLDFKDEDLEEKYIEYQTQQDIKDSFRGLCVVTGFSAIIGIVNLWVWYNILFIQSFYGKLKYMNIQAKSGIFFSIVCIAYTIVGFTLLWYLLVKKLKINSVLIDPNLSQICLRNSGSKEKLLNMKMKSNKIVKTIIILKILYFLTLGGLYLN